LLYKINEGFKYDEKEIEIKGVEQKWFRTLDSSSDTEGYVGFLLIPSFIILNPFRVEYHSGEMKKLTVNLTYFVAIFLLM
jgi:hypothetical protein